jgi:hypothetical protein
MKRKKGTPTKEVMTPIGISIGATTVRARRSARVRKTAPVRKETGRSTRWSDPTRRRTA